MPTFEFRCRQCGQLFETRMSWREKENAVCPACDSMKLQQLFTGINFLSRGAGSSKCSPPAGSRFS